MFPLKQGVLRLSNALATTGIQLDQFRFETALRDITTANDLHYFGLLSGCAKPADWHYVELNTDTPIGRENGDLVGARSLAEAVQYVLSQATYTKTQIDKPVALIDGSIYFWHDGIIIARIYKQPHFTPIIDPALRDRITRSLKNCMRHDFDGITKALRGLPQLTQIAPVNVRTKDLVSAWHDLSSPVLYDLRGWARIFQALLSKYAGAEVKSSHALDLFAAFVGLKSWQHLNAEAQMPHVTNCAPMVLYTNSNNHELTLSRICDTGAEGIAAFAQAVGDAGATRQVLAGCHNGSNDFTLIAMFIDIDDTPRDAVVLEPLQLCYPSHDFEPSHVTQAILNDPHGLQHGLEKYIANSAASRAGAVTQTAHDVIERLRPIFERAVKERSGVSYLMTHAEQQLITDSDMQKLKDETGYTAMCRGSYNPVE